jgi:hypothetical protein
VIETLGALKMTTVAVSVSNSQNLPTQAELRFPAPTVHMSALVVKATDAYVSHAHTHNHPRS